MATDENTCPEDPVGGSSPLRRERRMIEYVAMRLAEERISTLRREAERDALVRASRAARRRDHQLAGASAGTRTSRALAWTRRIVGVRRPVSGNLAAVAPRGAEPPF